MAQNDSFDTIRKWRSGVEFSFAWQRFADPYALDQYRETRSLQALNAQQSLMVADLWMGLRDGELQAIGNCVAPEISNGPVKLPKHIFEFPPPRGVGNDDAIEISGWRFVQVRICRPYDSSTEHPFVISELKDSIPQPLENETPKRGGGPKNLYTDVCTVLGKLFDETPLYRFEVAAKLLAPFNERYVAIFSASHIKRSPICERTLRNHLKLYRQELAETGKENFAS